VIGGDELDGSDSNELAEVQTWRGAALARNRRPRDICLDAYLNRKSP
jgi:hypothetical protein